MGAALQKVLALFGRKDVPICIYVRCAVARLGDAESRLGASIRRNQPDLFASRARSQNHAFGKAKFHFTWLQVGYHDCEFANQLSWLIG